MDIETFSKVLPIHMKIADMEMERAQRKLQAVTTVVEENEILEWLVQFLWNKLSDIEVDSIRHGLNIEEDYEKQEGKL